MPADTWDPTTYERHAELRAQPFWDLVGDTLDGGRSAEVPPSVRTMVDLGCGTGALTAALADRLHIADVVGIDSSPAMLERAAALARDGLRFEEGDIAAWRAPEPVDMVVANASLQWIGDHRSVLARWVDSLAPGGWLGVQVPANSDHPSHTCSTAVAHHEPFLSAMGGSPPPDPVAANVLAPEAYAELLHDLGLADIDVRLKVYPQVMESSAAVVDWTRGTSLTRFFAVLPDELHEPFVEAYRNELLSTIGDRAPYFYAFKRILLSARQPG